MRQLGDFATWLVMILIVLGAVYYAPKLVRYMSEDAARPETNQVAARESDSVAPRHRMAMRQGRFIHRLRQASTTN